MGAVAAMVVTILDSGDSLNTFCEMTWVWGMYRDDFKIPWNHRGALLGGVSRASRR